MKDFNFLASTITADGDCSHEIKKLLLLGRKAMTKKLDSILKSRDITLPTKVHIVKAVLFPEVMYGCEIWTIKKAECWRTDAFNLWCWKKLLRVSWIARRWIQYILKEINPENSLDRLMLKLKFQYFGYVMQRANSGKDPDAEKEWGQEEKGATEDEMYGWHHWLNGSEFEQALGVCEGQENQPCCNPWGYKESNMAEWLNNNSPTWYQ